MFFVAACDVVFTLLDVERYGLAGEVNPATKFLIGAGGVYLILWVAIDFASTILLYAPLISLFLMLPIETREGRASTIISLVLAVRVSVDLFNVTIYTYSFLESSTALVIVGLILMFVLRYIMRNGDYLSLGPLRSVFRRVGAGLRVKRVGGSFSRFSRLPEARSRAALADSHASLGTQETYASGLGDRPSPFTVKRSKRRIVVIAVLLLLLLIGVFALLQFLVVASGIGNQSGFGGLLYQYGAPLEGDVFLVGFLVAIIAVMVMVFLLMKLFDAIKGKTVLVQDA
jgi:hypothetical protein